MADWLSHHTFPQGFIEVRQVPSISLSTRCIALRDSLAWKASNSSASDVLVAVRDCSLLGFTNNKGCSLPFLEL
eukprot:410650-Amphidinium_carterae.1